MTKLLIKYKNSYICERFRNEIDFINIPMYHPGNEPFSNLSIFITLFASQNLSQDYSSRQKLNESTWCELFEEHFQPEYLQQVDTDAYIYDLDLLLEDEPKLEAQYQNIIASLAFPLTIKHPAELVNKNEEVEFTEDTLYDWLYPTTTINDELENFISKRHQQRTNKDCLLLYSGGKDSTLAAIRLHNDGYNVHFLHFNNGHMRDQDKPYLTFKEIFNQNPNYYFDYELSDVDIKKLFEEYFASFPSNLIDDHELLSEIRCLSCRMAMYTKAIQIAKERGYKYLAEGARISQKFMLEQLPLTNRLQELAKSYGIELLLPVLYVDDDQKEIEELLASGHSSKTWESKCLIGRPPKNKTHEDEQTIIDYYENILKPQVQKNIQYKKRLE